MIGLSRRSWHACALVIEHNPGAAWLEPCARCCHLQVSPVNHTRETIASKIQRLLNRPEFTAASAAASRKIRACCGAALAAWLLADFARGAPDVEPDSADSADDTVSDVLAAASCTAVVGHGLAAGTLGTTSWPKRDKNRGCGLARSAVNAH